MPAIGLLGDVMMGRAVAARLAEVAPAELWSEAVRAVCRELDLVICNLECCVSDRGRTTGRIAGKPFFFRAPPVAVEALGAIGVRAVSLANNHALDYEEDALVDTLAHLRRAQIAPVGAARSRDEAQRGVVLGAGDLRVGLACASDHPAEYAARGDVPGIAYADMRSGAPEWLREEVARLAARCDVVIAFPHWGQNMTARPTGWQRQAARELQDAGATLVAGHSAHVFHGIEWDAAGPIIADLGDALDDYAVDPLFRNDLGILAIWRPDGLEEELELVALKLDFCHVTVAAGSDADWICARLQSACTTLGTEVERLAEARVRIRPGSGRGARR